MGRLLLLTVALLVLIWLVRSALGRRRRGRPGNPVAHSDLVRCAHCGVHLPRAEARSAGERQFCSEEHARLGARED